MTDKAPMKLLDSQSDVGTEARRVLESGLGESPTAKQLASLAARLPLPGSPSGPGDGGADSGPGPAPDGGPGGGTSAGGGGGTAGAEAAGAAAKALGAKGVAAMIVGATLIVGGGGLLLLDNASGPGQVEITGSPAVIEPPNNLPVANPEERQPPEKLLSISTTEPREESQPEQEPDQPSALATAEPRRPSPTSAPAKSVESLPPREAEAADSGGSSEIELIREAQAALATSPTKALGLARTHASRFPQGRLAQEREVLAIDALIRLGRAGAARNRSDSFRRRWPDSSHIRRVDVLIGRLGDVSDAN